jgi:hypothetical protein
VKRGFFCGFFVLWWIGVFAGVFEEFRALDVVNLWWLRGKVRGEGGQEAGMFSMLKFSHYSQLFFQVSF